MAAQPVKNVILVGAGGNLGPPVLNALKNDGSFQVSVLSRHSSKSTFPDNVKVCKIADDYPPDALFEAFAGQDAVVSMIGVPHVLQQIPMIDAAKKAGVRLFLPAEYGGNKENPNTAAHPLLANKMKVLDHLKQSESEEFAWIGMATGPFFDWGLKNGFLGFDLKARKALIYDAGEVRWSATTLSGIGNAVTMILRQPVGMENKFVFVNSITTSQNEILSTLEKISEVKWDIEHTTTDKSIKNGQEKLARGDRGGALALILSTFFQDGWGADFPKSVVAASCLDLPKASLEQLVKEAMDG